MKSKKLIELLREVDPSGETEVCVGNCDIRDVDMLPAYYDGRLQTLKYDKEGYVIGGKYHSSGDKVDLRVLSIAEAIESSVEYANIDLDVDYSELSGETEKRYKEHDRKSKAKMQDMLESLELKMFKQWIGSYAENEEAFAKIEQATEVFFNQNLSRYSPELPKSEIPEKGPDGKPFWDSYENRRMLQWDKEIQIDWTDYSIKRIAGVATIPQVQKFTYYKDWNLKPPKSKPKQPVTFSTNLKTYFKNFLTKF